MNERPHWLWQNGRDFLRAVARGAWRGAAARLRDLHQARRLLSPGWWSSLGRLTELFEDLRRGGLEVMTPDREGRPALSTLITSGGLVSRVSPAVLRQPELGRAHREAVARRLEPLTGAAAMARGLSGLLAAIAAIVGTYSLSSAGVAATDGLDALVTRLGELWVEVRWAIVAGALTAAGRFILQRRLRAEIEKLLS